MNEVVDELLARTDLAALMDELVPIATGHGPSRRWQCPDPGHDDQHPSVTIRRGTDGHERWRCWSGGHRGDALDLIQAARHLDHPGAVAWLADHARYTPPPKRRTAAPPIPARPVGEPSPLIARYSRMCQAVLWGPQGAPARDWLHQRGLTDPVLHANHVGYDLGRDRMRRTRGLPPGYQPGITFPTFDHAGQLTYVQTRNLHHQSDATHNAKYVNPASALATNPRHSWTQPAGPTIDGVTVICEGIPDALIATQAGYHTIAIIGTANADPTTASIIARHTAAEDTVIWICDADAAGRSAADHFVEHLTQHDRRLTIIEPPQDGWDLTDWAGDDLGWAAAVADLVGCDRPSPVVDVGLR